MESKRMLVIEKLIVSVPDEVKAADGREELTIDDILQWFLDYRKSQQAVIENQAGNFKYFYTNMPSGMIPDLPSSMDTNDLTTYLLGRSDFKAAGCMAALIWDEDLQAYRNCYTEDEMKIFNQRKTYALQQRQIEEMERKMAESKANTGASCDGCDEICSERCPDEAAVEAKMREDEDE